MKTPDEMQAEYEARLALRQLEARGVIDADVRFKIEQKLAGKPQNPFPESINAKISHETATGCDIIPPYQGKWWENGPEWLSDGKRPDQWTFSAAVIAGAAVLGLAFLAFWTL